jgi:dienelactone hydrolase
MDRLSNGAHCGRSKPPRHRSNADVRPEAISLPSDGSISIVPAARRDELMKIAAMPAVLLLWPVVLGCTQEVRAAELVEVAQHRAALASAQSDVTPPLLGFLTRPNGPGRFPAVILLHGCSPFDAHTIAAAETVKSWGYIGLALDSLGAANVCEGRSVAGAGAEVLDAYAGLRYLTAQSFVAGARIAVMGWSMGGDAALAAVEKGWSWSTGMESFAAAVAYYPKCAAHSGVLTASGLILVGEQDDWAPAAPCRKLAAHESDVGMTRTAREGASIDLEVYPNAAHGFDYRSPTHIYLGHLVQFDETAARDSETRVRTFLRRIIGDQEESP